MHILTYKYMYTIVRDDAITVDTLRRVTMLCSAATLFKGVKKKEQATSCDGKEERGKYIEARKSVWLYVAYKT